MIINIKKITKLSKSPFILMLAGIKLLTVAVLLLMGSTGCGEAVAKIENENKASYKDNTKASAMSLRMSFADSLQKVTPAVVNIFSENIPAIPKNKAYKSPQEFLSNRIKNKVDRSLGSGVIITADGYIATNYHVIKGATSIKVVFNNGEERIAEFVGADSHTDVAILKLIGTGGEKFPFVKMAENKDLLVGDILFALGNPYGVGQSVSMGIVSAVARSNVGGDGYENFIQTDAAVNPGSSGGALVDSLGELVGLNAAIYSHNGGNQGIAFATPVILVRKALNSILETGRITRPWFGIRGKYITPTLAKELDLKDNKGALITEVAVGSSADKATIKVGDIILNFDGKKVKDINHLDVLVEGALIATPLDIKIWSKGSIVDLKVSLEGVPGRSPNDVLVLRDNHPLKGYQFERLTIPVYKAYNISYKETGIVVTDIPEHVKSHLLQRGDVIVRLNNIEISSLNDLRNIVIRRPRQWRMTVKRAGLYKNLRLDY